MNSYRTLTLALTLCLAAPLLAAEDPKTYGERLGWGPDDRILMIHSDDLGMSLETNLATIETIEFGLVTSVSMMMPTPWVPHFAQYIKENPDLCVGLHLTMTSEWEPYRWGPVAGKPAVPSLVDEQGALHDNNTLLYESGTPDDVEREIRAQIDRALTMGIEVTHLDSHMGSLFRNPEYFARWKKVAIEKQIPMLMIGGHPAAEEVWEAGLPVIDHLHTASYSWRTREKRAEYIDAIRNLRPGITEMIVHPTKPGEVVDKITGGRELLYGDYFALTSPEVKAAVEEEGIILTTWRELKERRDRVQAEANN